MIRIKVETDSSGEPYATLFFVTSGYVAGIFLYAKLVWILIGWCIKQKGKSRQENETRSARQPWWRRRSTSFRTAESTGADVELGKGEDGKSQSSSEATAAVRVGLVIFMASEET